MHGSEEVVVVKTLLLKRVKRHPLKIIKVIILRLSHLEIIFMLKIKRTLKIHITRLKSVE